jgi:hypothetical protein
MNIIQQYRRDPSARAFIDNLGEQSLGNIVRSGAILAASVGGKKVRDSIGETESRKSTVKEFIKGARDTMEKLKAYRSGAAVGVTSQEVDNNREKHSQFLSRQVPRSVPPPILVGVETNPGPKRSNKNKGAQPPKYNSNMSPNAPVAIASRVQTKRPVLVNSKRGEITYSGSELVTGSIPGSVAFTVANSYSINPGNSTLFPLLSTLAALFSQYRFTHLAFRYVPVVPTSTQGDVLLFIDYDASNPAPTTETQAADHEDAIEDVVWRDIGFQARVASLNGTCPYHFVRTALMPGDIKTYDSGNFFFCTNNETGTNTIGKLYVDYTCVLRSPLLTNNQGLKPSTISAWYDSGSPTYTSNTPSYMFFDTQIAESFGIIKNTDNKTFTVPSGYWEVTASGIFKDTSAETFTGSMYGLLNSVSMTTGFPGGFTVTNVANGYQQMTCRYLFSVPPGSTGAIVIGITMIGAAGTLSSLGNDNIISFRLL